MANKVEQKEVECETNQHKYTTAEGRLVAVSHIYYTRPNMLLIELIEGQTTHHVAISERKHIPLQKQLNIGASYRFTYLKKTRIHYSDGRIAVVYVSTDASSFLFYNDIKIALPKPICGSVFYTGVVTGAEPSLGLYEVDYRKIVFLHFLIKYCNAPLPEIGKKITIYNAHFWRNTELKRCAFILCGRSYITIEGEKAKPESLNNRADILEQYGTIWMGSVRETVQQKFSSDFLRMNLQNMRHSVPVFQQKILLQYIMLHYTSKKNDRHMTAEFLSQPHECVFTKSESLPNSNFVMLIEARKEMKKHIPRNLQTKSWGYSVNARDANKTALVGLINVKNGCWMFSDATCSFPCIVTGTVDELSQLSQICNGILLIRDYKCIVEVFKDKNLKILIYIQFNAKDALFLCGDGSNYDNKRKREDDTDELQRNIKLKDDVANMKKSCHEKGKDTPNHVTRKEENANSCLVRVLHKSTPALLPKSKMTICCILVIFIERKSEPNLLYLALTGKLVCVLPILVVGRLYRLSLPGQKSCQLFENRCRLKALSHMLPNVMGKVLPEDCEIFPIAKSRCTTCLLNNIYRVDDTSFHEEAGQRELVDVEGIITDRLHTKIKFNSEKYESEAENFGVPDNQNIVLKLKGTESKNGEVTLYLNNWGSRAYPLGLLPGAKIQARYIAKYTSQASARTYFQATELTRIEILLQAQQEDVTKSDVQWTKPCILTKEVSRVAPGTILCGLVSTIKVWKVTAEVICSYCTEAFQSGKCNKCIFSAIAPQLRLSVNCFIEDIFGEVILIVQRDQAYQLFERTRAYWNVLARVIAKEHNKITILDTDVPKTTGERILHCIITVVNNKPCHWLVLARKLRPQNSGQRGALLCIELQKPEPSLMQSLLKETLPNRLMDPVT